MDIESHRGGLESPAFVVSPVYGAKANFSSINESITYGDNHTSHMAGGINSLSMTLTMTFDALTDFELQQSASYLQSRMFYQIPQYDSAGKFSNQRVEPFEYQPFYPYKKNNFYCLKYDHTKVHYNVNTLSAEFVCAHPPTTDSVESYRGYNGIVDTRLVSNAAIDGTGEQEVPFSNPPGVSYDLQPSNNIFPSGTYKNVEVLNYSTSSPIKLSSHFPVGAASTFVVPNTAFRNSIFIHNPNECSYYPYSPTVEGDTIKTRMFDFRPSSSIKINSTPKHMSSAAGQVYKKFAHYGFNPNLTNLSLTFKQRDDLEAKRILLFLESHLGCKKFGFHLPEPYRNPIHSSLNRTPHRRTFSHFYCPDWSHRVIYKDNHEITVTFIECLDH